MRILYSVQATGNGHISRAMELLPHLKQFGEVDIFLSGSNSQLALDAPVKYRSKGLSLFYNCSGGLDYWKMLKGLHPFRLRQEIQELPVEKYDLVINDFEYITAAACARKSVYSINFGHQASFMSDLTPRPPQRSKAGEFVLKNYAKASEYVGLHFCRYDDFIFTPVIKQQILEAEPSDAGYITVYLPAYCEQQLREFLAPLKDISFQVFSGERKDIAREGQIEWMPVDKGSFNKSLINCHAIICGAGFETPAEALHLGKKVLAIPIRSQYEQQCNAAALAEMGVATLDRIDEHFATAVRRWLSADQPINVDYRNSVAESLDHLFAHCAVS
ncbi:MAG: glycosyltransferase family protein [Chitinophagaceae bacterium]